MCIRFEVPSESLSELRTQVMEKVLLFGSSHTDRLIANKLCLAMSALVLHTIEEDWPDAVTQIISTFQTYSGIPVCCRDGGWDGVVF